MLLSEVRPEVEKLVLENPSIKPSQILKYLKDEFDVSATRQALYFSMRDWGLQDKRMINWDDYKQQIEKIIEESPYISLRALKELTAGEKANMRGTESLQTFLERSGLDKKIFKPKQVAQLVRDYKEKNPQALIVDVARHMQEAYRINLRPATVSNILKDGSGNQTKRGALENHKEDVLDLMKKNPLVRTVEIQQHLKEKYGVDVSLSAVIYNLKKWDRRKKRGAYQIQSDEHQKQKLRSKLK